MDKDKHWKATQFSNTRSICSPISQFSQYFSLPVLGLGPSRVLLRMGDKDQPCSQQNVGCHLLLVTCQQCCGPASALPLAGFMSMNFFGFKLRYRQSYPSSFLADNYSFKTYSQGTLLYILWICIQGEILAQFNFASLVTKSEGQHCFIINSPQVESINSVNQGWRKGPFGPWRPHVHDRYVCIAAAQLQTSFMGYLS